MTDITDEDRRALATLDDALGFLMDNEREIVASALSAHRLAAEARGEARGAERERALLTEQFNGVYQVALADQAAARREAKALRDAAKELLAGMSSTFRARNGRDVGIEADDGEKCWIVHSDLITGLAAALSRHADQGAVL